MVPQGQWAEQRESILLDPSPCIVLATSGMMTGGPIVEYFKNWAPNRTTPYVSSDIKQTGPSVVDFRKALLKCQLMIKGKHTWFPLDAMSLQSMVFSGHSDRRQLMDYVKAMNPKPRTIICHHGDASTCAEFRKDLASTYRIRTHAPKNLETLRLF